MNGSIEKIAELIVHSNRIVVFVGAGLSTESGIPDFRSPGVSGTGTIRRISISEVSGKSEYP